MTNITNPTNQTLGIDRIKYGLLPTPKPTINKEPVDTIYKTPTCVITPTLNKNRLLGVDRIKIRVPCLFLKKDYSKYFKFIGGHTNLDKDLYTVSYKFTKATYKHTNLKIGRSSKNSNKNYEYSDYLEIDLNIPKLIHGNNIYESTNADLINAVYRFNPILIVDSIRLGIPSRVILL